MTNIVRRAAEITSNCSSFLAAKRTAARFRQHSARTRARARASAPKQRRAPGCQTAIATTEAMKQVRTLARVLGPKGLMPNPKSGTVTDDIAAGIKAVKAGRVEFKMDKAAIIGVGVGKCSFTPAQVLENALAVIDAVGKAKPASFKGGVFIKSITLSSSMSPGVRVASSEFSKY